MKQFISDLVAGSKVNSKFSVKYKHPTRQYKNGYMFNIGLADKTGEIELVFFGGTKKESVDAVYSSFKEDDVIEIINGKCDEFRKEQAVIRNITINEGMGEVKKASDYALEDFVPVTEEDIGKMADFIKSVVNEVKNPHIKKLLDSFFFDKSFFEEFNKAPAAMYIHHAYVGGLLEHTIHVLKICENIASIYPQMDRDLLLAGAMLHDIGKIKEFQVTTNIKETEEGMLRGHIVLGEEMVLEKIGKLADFPNVLKLKIAHIMLSHHGNSEFGSPKNPCFSEAVAVYYADELDSKTDQFVKIKENVQTEDFRTYSKRLGSVYLK